MMDTIEIWDKGRWGAKVASAPSPEELSAKLGELGPAKVGTQPEVVVAVGPAFGTGLTKTIGGLAHEDVLAAILTGSLIVEQIFGLPGIGRYFIQGALNRDYTLVLGVVIFYAAFIILLNLVADLLYAVLDPRVSYR